MAFKYPKLRLITRRFRVCEAYLFGSRNRSHGIPARYTQPIGQIIKIFREPSIYLPRSPDRGFDAYRPSGCASRGGLSSLASNRHFEHL